MGTCRIPAVIIAVAIGGVGLAACGTSGSTPPAVPSAAAGSSSALAGAPTSALTDTPSPSPSASHTHRHSTAVHATAHPTSSAHVTLTPHATSSSSSSGGTHNFTVPAIPGENVVEG